MKGKFYGVGVGPGDPGLLTIKAKRILEAADFIAVPKTAADKESLALKIALGAIEKRNGILELLFPMSYDGNTLGDSWNTAILAVRKKLDEGSDVAFITLGDPMVFSTFIYVYKELKRQGYETEVVPGITSFCASAARAGVSLAEGSETLAIIPSAYDCSELDDIFDKFDNVVLMKISRNFARLVDKLEKHGLKENSVMVSRCGCEDERIERELGKVDPENVHYMSTIIVKKKQL